MPKPQYVSEFMEDFLYNALVEQGFIVRTAVEGLAESRYRNNGIAVKLGTSKNEVEIRHEQIKANETKSMCKTASLFAENIEEGLGSMLGPSLYVCPLRNRKEMRLKDDIAKVTSESFPILVY
jgi:hypothetical protein